MAIKNSIRIFSALIVLVFLASCGSETDSGMKNALDSGNVTGDINENTNGLIRQYLHKGVDLSP